MTGSLSGRQGLDGIKLKLGLSTVTGQHGKMSEFQLSSWKWRCVDVRAV